MNENLKSLHSCLSDLHNHKFVLHCLRGRNGHRIAVLIAVKFGNDVRVGWSHWNKKDRYDKRTALSIAFTRAQGCAGAKSQTHEIRKALPEFIARAKRYFKTDIVFCNGQ